MGSPIETWDGAAAYFTGAGSAMPGVILVISAIFCVVAIAMGAAHEAHAYKSLED